MSKFIYITLFFLSFTLSNTASAGAVFDANCVACHKGGGNIMDAKKTLSMDHLKANGANSKSKIKALVKGGKGAMPPFAALSDEQLDSVAGYVLDQAKKGW